MGEALRLELSRPAAVHVVSNQSIAQADVEYLASLEVS